MIEAYITNLGKYNEGELRGEYLKLPAEKEDVQALLARIGVDGVLYEEIIITDYRTDVDGLCRHLGEYESVDELNYLASLLDDMDDSELAIFESALEYGEHTSCVEHLVNLAQNLDCYDLHPDIMDNEGLGVYHVGQLSETNIPEFLEHYIDYEACGEDTAINEGGVFTGNGYIINNGDTFTEHYKGRHIPDDYRVFAYPDLPCKMPIKEQLEMYAKMTAAPAAGKAAPARAER
jgi:antirestriction protein